MLAWTMEDDDVREDPKRPVDAHVGFNIKSYIFGIFQCELVRSNNHGQNNNMVVM